MLALINPPALPAFRSAAPSSLICLPGCLDGKAGIMKKNLDSLTCPELKD
jgi:hypothetical protein